MQKLSIKQSVHHLCSALSTKQSQLQQHFLYLCIVAFSIRLQFCGSHEKQVEEVEIEQWMQFLFQLQIHNIYTWFITVAWTFPLTATVQLVHLTNIPVWFGLLGDI